MSELLPTGYRTSILVEALSYSASIIRQERAYGFWPEAATQIKHHTSATRAADLARDRAVPAARNIALPVALIARARDLARSG